MSYQTLLLKAMRKKMRKKYSKHHIIGVKYAKKNTGENGKNATTKKTV